VAGGGNASSFGQIMPCAGSGPARLVVTHRGRDSPARLCSFRFRAAPALLVFAADAGAFAALGGQHVGVAGVGITPARVVLQLAGQRGVIPVVRAAHDKGAYWTELRLDRIGPGCVRGREAQLDVLAPADLICKCVSASNLRASLSWANA